MSEAILRARCACGWEVTGPEAAVVEATIDHGTRVHNMAATPEQVLAQAEVIAPGDGQPAPTSVASRADPAG
jgi:hypothetical protein